MDRSWILSSDRLCREYKEGIASFIRVARNQLNDDNECLCPCRNCVNRSLQSLETIEAHIVRYGFQLSYDVWVCHGEREKTPSTFLTGSFSGAREVVNEPITITEQMEEHVDVLGPLFDDLGYGAAVNEGSEQPFVGTKFKLFGSTDKLYPGCKFTTLEAVIRLMKIKVDYRWSDKSFEMVLQFIKLMWPDLKDFPTSIYDARKRLRDVGLGYNNIDACKNDCSLFWKDHANDERCHVCNESRYKVNDGRGKKIPHKSLRYFPLIPRLQRLFISRHTAKDMRWHKEKRDDSSNTLIHPADGEAWQHFDQTYPDFADDPRNVRLGLAADGFSPFSASYSMWPVIVVPYNLPPWRCMQKQFRFLSLLIPGEKLDFTVLTAGKVKLTFKDGTGRPDTKRDNDYLVGECGKLARTNVPFKLTSFTKIRPEDFELLVIRLQSKFEWDPSCDKAPTFIYQTIKKAYNSFKNECAQRVLKHSSHADALQDKHPAIGIPDWEWWVKYVHSDEYQKLSKTNKENRSKQPYSHRGGSKAFVFHMMSRSEADGLPEGFIEYFKRTHWTLKDGWINDVAENHYCEMKRIVEESKDDPDGPMSEYDAGQLVLGRKSGWVRGMGRSVRPHPKLAPLHIEQVSKIKLLENELEDLQAKIKAQDDMIKAQEERQNAQEEKMTKMYEMMTESMERNNLQSPGIGHSRDGSSPFVAPNDGPVYDDAC